MMGDMIRWDGIGLERLGSDGSDAVYGKGMIEEGVIFIASTQEGWKEGF